MVSPETRMVSSSGGATHAQEKNATDQKTHGQKLKTARTELV